MDGVKLLSTWVNISTVYSLVSSPLHLSLVLAGKVILVTLQEVGDAAELLVVVDRLILGPKGVNNI